MGRVSSLVNELQVDEDMSFDINYMIAIFCFSNVIKEHMLMPDSLLTRQRLFSDTETRVRKHSLI